MPTNKIPDEVYNGNWTSLLKLFRSTNREDKDAKEKFQSIIEMAKTKVLTARQMEGMIARCRYQIHLIDNPDAIPSSNFDKKEDRNTYQLSQSESNGKH